MIGRTQQETAQLSAIWTLAAVSPMWFMMAITAAPNGLLARALSFFPLTMPVTMMIRLSIGGVPVVDILASVVIGVIAIYLAAVGAARHLPGRDVDVRQTTELAGADSMAAGSVETYL